VRSSEPVRPEPDELSLPDVVERREIAQRPWLYARRLVAGGVPVGAVGGLAVALRFSDSPWRAALGAVAGALIALVAGASVAFTHVFRAHADTHPRLRRLYERFYSLPRSED
jgi:hypothetical protein